MVIFSNSDEEIDTIVEGQFINNSLDGYGRVIWNNGDYYDGQFITNAIRNDGNNEAGKGVMGNLKYDHWSFS